MFSEDLDVFFNPAEFASAATYNGVTAVNVIFDAAYLEQFGVSGTNPVALGKASDFAASAVGKTLLIGAVTYTIRGRENQDDGSTVLLQLSAP